MDVMTTSAHPPNSPYLLALLQSQEQILASCTSLTQVYEFMGYLAEQVHAAYPIGCFAGCSACCVVTNTPTLTLAEWLTLFRYLQTFDSLLQREVVRRTAAYCGPRLDLIWELQQTLDLPVGMERWHRVHEVMPRLGIDDCLFLVRGLCGVYSARPAKCRAHGNFILRYDEIVQMHSCEPEQHKFEGYLAGQANRRLLMPLWNVFEKRIRELNPAGSPVTALPVWMLYHVDDQQGTLVPAVIDRPDWSRLADPDKRAAWQKNLAALMPQISNSSKFPV